MDRIEETFTDKYRKLTTGRTFTKTERNKRGNIWVIPSNILPEYSGRQDHSKAVRPLG